MSLFHSKPLPLENPLPSPPIVKKKRTFFRGHVKSDSSSSLKDIMISPREIPVTPMGPLSAKELLIHHPHLHNAPVEHLPSSPRRRRSSATTRRLQKRPPSSHYSSGSNRTSPTVSPVPSPNYVLEKPPRIGSKEYTPAHQNLYIMDDGQDDEMYTLFEMISGSKPLNNNSPYNNNRPNENKRSNTLPNRKLSTSRSSNPELSSLDAQRCELRQSRKGSLGRSNTVNNVNNATINGHSRNTSASSEYSVLSTDTYQTDLSDFQFEFNPHHHHSLLNHQNANIEDTKETSMGVNREFTFPPSSLTARKVKSHDSRLNNAEVMNGYEDCVTDLTDDDGEDDDVSVYSFEEGDDLDYGVEDVVLEKGVAVRVRIVKCHSPTLVRISPRSSCEL